VANRVIVVSDQGIRGGSRDAFRRIWLRFADDDRFDIALDSLSNHRWWC